MSRTDEQASGASSRGAPSALLIFLIADVRGYTNFTNEHGDEAAARLTDRFAGVCEEVVVEHDGVVIELRGDEALCTFSSARNALRGAVALREAFRQAVAQDPSLPLNVGMGLDAGEAIPLRGGYRGGALNLAARLCSLAGPGDILSSEGVTHLARKIEGLAFVDRGQVTLKGLTAPVRVFQVAPEGELADDMAPLEPILVTRTTNLPDDSTTFIGRQEEIKAVTHLLRNPNVRLVTLTGTGGTGKTRLALQVGSAMLHDFDHGVFFSDLATLADANLVPSAIAHVLGVKEDRGRDLTETLIERLKQKHLLLILDNFEHLLDACNLVTDLLEACHDLHILVTSRTPLHLSREHELAVPPLPVPDPRLFKDAASLLRNESVKLFVQRAKAVKNTFDLTDENAPAIAEICSRLDGLPLALELAAARIRLFPPQALVQRLTSRLTILTGGAKDRPTRQQTLRGAIDWSYSLLTQEEQTLFSRLSAFAGQCTFDGVEKVCNSDGDLDVIEGMASLVSKSLIRQVGESEPRFDMLETIRDYAREKLHERGESKKLAELHSHYILTVVESAHSNMHGPERGQWLELLHSESDNLRLALREAKEQGDKVCLTRLVAGVAWYWSDRGDAFEGRQWLEEIAALGCQVPPQWRAHIHYWAGSLARGMTDYTTAERHLQNAFDFYSELGDQRGKVETLYELAACQFEVSGIDAALPLMDEYLGAAQELGDSLTLAKAHNAIGIISWTRGEYPHAVAFTEQALEAYRRLKNAWGTWHALSILGYIARDERRCSDANNLFREALQIAHGQPDVWGMAFDLEGLACIAAVEGHPQRAATLWGAAAAMRESIAAPLHPTGEEQNRPFLDAAQQQIDESQWLLAWTRGHNMSFDEAVTYAMREEA